MCDLCMCMFLQKCERTKISPTHPYPYSFHENYPPCIIETSLLCQPPVCVPTQLRVVESFRPLSHRAKYSRVQDIEHLRSAYKPNTVHLSKFSPMDVESRRATNGILDYSRVCCKNANDCHFTPGFFLFCFVFIHHTPARLPQMMS